MNQNVTPNYTGPNLIVRCIVAWSIFDTGETGPARDLKLRLAWNPGVQNESEITHKICSSLNILKFPWLEIKRLRSQVEVDKKIDIKLQYNHANLRAGSQKE